MNHYDAAFPGELDTNEENLLFYVDYSDAGTYKVDRTYMDREKDTYSSFVAASCLEGFYQCIMVKFIRIIKGWI